MDSLYGALVKVQAKYGDAIATNLAVSGAEPRLMNPRDYERHLQTQQKIYIDAVKHLTLEK